MKIVELTEDDFNEKTCGGIVVILFYSDSSCKNPVELLKLAANHVYSDEVKFMMINGDRYSEIAQRFEITGFPAALFMRNGVRKNLLQGVNDPQKILESAQENACYRCAMTRSRTEKRKKRRF
jgi:thioredoxin-like negative regulator of GroEL